MSNTTRSRQLRKNFPSPRAHLPPDTLRSPNVRLTVVLADAGTHPLAPPPPLTLYVAPTPTPPLSSRMGDPSPRAHLPPDTLRCPNARPTVVLADAGTHPLAPTSPPDTLRSPNVRLTVVLANAGTHPLAPTSPLTLYVAPTPAPPSSSQRPPHRCPRGCGDPSPRAHLPPDTLSLPQRPLRC